MLAAVENHFVAALRPALLRTAQVSAGPADPKAHGATVEVWAERLTLADASEDLGDERGAARYFLLHTWPGDGKTAVFRLPGGDFELAEVEAPPGRPRSRGDDYVVEGGVIRFLRPPAASDVRALLLERPARGFIERRRGALTVVLSLRAATGLEGLVDAALAAALRACVDLPAIEAEPASGVRVRLRRPVAALVGVARRERAGDSARERCDIELLVRGELEMTVVVGKPEPEDRIARVERDVSLLP